MKLNSERGDTQDDVEDRERADTDRGQPLLDGVAGFLVIEHRADRHADQTNSGEDADDSKLVDQPEQHTKAAQDVERANRFPESVIDIQTLAVDVNFFDTTKFGET